MTSTYKTGETIAVGDLVRIGSGEVEYRVDMLNPNGVQLRRITARTSRRAPANNKWQGDTDRLVLITAASDAERAAVARKLAEVEAEGERIQEHRAAHRRVAAFVDQHADTPSYSDKILSLGRMVDGEVADFTLTISDLRTLLAGLDR